MYCTVRGVRVIRLLVRQEVAKWAKGEWKHAISIERKRFSELELARRLRHARYKAWDKQSRRKGVRPSGKWWDTMMEEDLKVERTKVEWLTSVALQWVAKCGEREAQLACKDAIIRDLRARVRRAKC